MQDLKIILDGRAAALEPGPGLSDKGEVLVPVSAFCRAVGAEAKQVDGSGPLAVCRGDLCIRLEETVSLAGTAFAPLAAFGEPLGLRWRVEGGTLCVETSGAAMGLGIGCRPPAFALPDLYTGERVALEAYRGRKTVFYLWASW